MAKKKKQIKKAKPKTQKRKVKKAAKKSVKKPAIKKSAPKKKRKKKTNPVNTGNRSLVIIKDNPGNQKPKKRKKKGKAMAQKKNKSSGNPGNPGRKAGMMKTVQEAAGVVGGAVGAGVLANMVPLPDPRMKAIIPLAAGILLATTKMGRTVLVKNMALGMMAAGGLAVVRQFMPNVPLLAGEDDMYLDYVPDDQERRAMLGQEDDLLLGQDEQDIDEALDGDSELLGTQALLGEEKWLTPSSM